MTVRMLCSKLCPLAAALALIACAPLMANSSEAGSSPSSKTRAEAAAAGQLAVVAEYPAAMMAPPPADLPETEVDRVLGNNSWKVTQLDSSLIKKQAQQSSPGAISDGNYTLQFEAVGDFDAAQKRRWALQARSGYSLSLVFDSPFYKIRGGSFTKKEAAEEAVRRLQDAGVTAFVIKLK